MYRVRLRMKRLESWYRNEMCFDELKRTVTFEKYIYDLPWLLLYARTFRHSKAQFSVFCFYLLFSAWKYTHTQRSRTRIQTFAQLLYYGIWGSLPDIGFIFRFFFFSLFISIAMYYVHIRICFSCCVFFSSSLYSIHFIY